MARRPDKSGKCEICGIWRRILQRDRKIPGRNGGAYVPENIQWICANCHQDKTSLEQSAAHKGRPKPPEQRAKMSAWQIGKKLSEETKEKIRQKTILQMSDPAMRENLAEKARQRMAIHGNYWKGKKLPEEMKAKISASLIGHGRPRKEPWVAEGISKTTYYRRLRKGIIAL